MDSAAPSTRRSRWLLQPEAPLEETLDDGQRVELSLIGPADRADLLNGFAGLSPRSRYLRFFSRMPQLPDFIVDALLSTDDEDHLAIAARLVGTTGTIEPAIVGVARYLRTEAASRVAEPSIAVVDRLHGRGLGRVLLRHLTWEARARGITHFRAHALADNDRIRRILRASGGVIAEYDGPVLVYDVDIRRRRSASGRLRRVLGAMFSS